MLEPEAGEGEGITHAHAYECAQERRDAPSMSAKKGPTATLKPTASHLRGVFDFTTDAEGDDVCDVRNARGSNRSRSFESLASASTTITTASDETDAEDEKLSLSLNTSMRTPPALATPVVDAGVGVVLANGPNGSKTSPSGAGAGLSTWGRLLAVGLLLLALLMGGVLPGGGGARTANPPVHVPVVSTPAAVAVRPPARAASEVSEAAEAKAALEALTAAARAAVAAKHDTARVEAEAEAASAKLRAEVAAAEAKAAAKLAEASTALAAQSREYAALAEAQVIINTGGTVSVTSGEGTVTSSGVVSIRSTNSSTLGTSGLQEAAVATKSEAKLPVEAKVPVKAEVAEQAEVTAQAKADVEAAEAKAARVKAEAAAAEVERLRVEAMARVKAEAEAAEAEATRVKAEAARVVAEAEAAEAEATRVKAEAEAAEAEAARVKVEAEAAEAVRLRVEEEVNKYNFATGHIAAQMQPRNKFRPDTHAYKKVPLDYRWAKAQHSSHTTFLNNDILSLYHVHTASTISAPPTTTHQHHPPNPRLTA